jgi:hypothetical protein
LWAEQHLSRLKESFDHQQDVFGHGAGRGLSGILDPLDQELMRSLITAPDFKQAIYCDAYFERT